MESASYGMQLQHKKGNKKKRGGKNVGSGICPNLHSRERGGGFFRFLLWRRAKE